MQFTQDARKVVSTDSRDTPRWIMRRKYPLITFRSTQIVKEKAIKASAGMKSAVKHPTTQLLNEHW